MSNTIAWGDGFLTIVPDGATDFDINTYFPAGIRLTGISFNGSAASDVLIVRDGSVTGAFLVAELANDDDINFNGHDCKPYIKAADCTFGTPASCVITIYWE